MNCFLSKYGEELPGAEKARYLEKLSACELEKDPYDLDKKDLDASPVTIPEVKWSDMFVYLMSTPSQHTREEMRAWKSMTGSDSFMQAGWVHDMRLKAFNSKHGETRYLILGRVKHSQRMTATPLLPWFVAEKSGEIVSAHCTCMAGLGEACSHVAALITCVISANEQRKLTGLDACTSQTCVWLPSKRDVSAAKISTIDFTSPAMKKKKGQPSQHTQASKDIAKPTTEELASFHSAIASTKPVLHHILDDYAREYVPLSATGKLPKPLSMLYNPDALKWNFAELLQNCTNLFDTSQSFQITDEQCKELESRTRDQASSKVWFQHRAGRITASVFHSAVKTNPAMPSPSLIKKICHPEAYRFSTAATRWGCEHEKLARRKCVAQLSSHHKDLVVEDCGFIINPNLPHLGATPDGILKCECCKPRLIEVKCPYCYREGLPNEDKDTKNLCVKKVDGLWQLKKEHPYYYQVQAQLNVCNVNVCVFVLWTNELIVQEVERDNDFLRYNLPAVTHFFKTGILPELVGKWQTRKPVESNGIVDVPVHVEEESVSAEDDPNTSWCFCERPSFGDMVACDNKLCSIGWFHMECLMMRVPPKGKWYCPHCRKLPKFSKSRKHKLGANTSTKQRTEE